MKAPSRRTQTRAAVMRFYHAAQWIVIAVIVAAAFAAQPQLRGSLAFVSASAAYLVCVLFLARLRWPIRREEDRLVTGFVLTLIGMAAVVWFGGPALNGLVMMFAFATTTAWLVLPRNRSFWVMVLAFLLSGVVTFARDPSVFNALHTLALSAMFVLLARVAEIAVHRAAIAAAAVAAASGRDALTGLPGRHAFIQDAEQLHAEASTSKTPYAIEIVDIDNLRAINDSYGYASGDRAIVVVARALERLRLPEEPLARLEGDKFALLVPGLDGARADDLARRIRSVVFSTTINVDTEVVRIKANVGVAKYPLAGVTLNALISAAERDVQVDKHGREPPAKKPVFRRRPGTKSA